MKRLTMIKERLSKIGVSKHARFGALSRRAVLALMVGLTVVGTVCPVGEIYAAHSSVPEMVPSSGKDFWLTYMYNFGQDNDNISLELSVVAMKADATVTITTGDGTPLLTSQAVSAGSAFTLEIPTLLRSKVYNTGSDSKQSTGVHVQATSDVVVYLRNGYSSGSDFSYDISPVISTSALGTEYMIQSYYRDMSNNVFAIVATEDGTTVDIKLNTNALKPSLSPTDLYHKGDVLTRTMNAGEVIQIRGARYNATGQGDLSGTTVKSDKPIAVFNGGIKTSIPFNAGYNGDHTVEQAIPISAWGKRFVAMEMSGFPVRDAEDGHVETSSPTQYMITALYDDTYVLLNGNPVDTLAAGESLGYNRISALYYSKVSVAYNEVPKLVETNNPVMVQAFMSSGAVNQYEYDVFSEPSTALIPDVNKGVDTSYIFCWASPSTLHYVNVVVPAIGVSGMKLNGTDVSGQFTTMGTTFRDYPDYYAYARLTLTDGVNVLTNNKARFVAVAYSTELYAALSEANAGLLNLAPTAPVVFIDDKEAIHMDTLEYCNQHPGIHFTALIDYPHDSIRWYLGENVVVHETVPAERYTTSHMYGQTISESDTTHNIRFFVYHHSPITNIKDTDSVSVVIRVHPAYYDTLETWVAAKDLRYEWINSSEHAFGLSSRGQYDLRYKDGNSANGPAVDDANGRRAAIVYGKDATNPLHKWTDPDNPEVTEIFDSLMYETSTHGCDSIFYLKLHVTKNIIMPIDSDTICQGEVYAWPRHAAGTGHKLSRRMIGSETIYLCKDGGSGYGTKCDSIYSTKVPGWFEIRDTIRSLTYPYPGEPEKNVDTIFIKRLHVSYKPTIKITNRKDSLCEAIPDATLSWTVNYTAAYADSLYFELRTSPGNVLKRSGGMRRTTQTSFNIGTLGTLEDGTYELSVQAFNDTLCESLVDKVPLVIKNRPSVKVGDIDPQCYPAQSFNVVLTPSDVHHVVYSVDDKITATTLNLPGTLTINPAGWADGLYTLRVKPYSALGCDSTEVVKNFVIYKQPSATIVGVENQCDNVTSTIVTYNTADADTCYYYIKSQGKGTIKGVKKSNGANGTFALDISGLNTTTVDLVDTLLLVSNSATCHSDTAKFAFTIWAMPTAKITSLPADLNGCAPSSQDLSVSYTTTKATHITWSLWRGSMSLYSIGTPIGTVLTIPKSYLTQPGSYSLHIESVSNTMTGCVTNNPAPAFNFTMYDPAKITLNHIDSVCVGNAVTSTYTAEYTDSYIFKVDTIGGATKINHTTPVTTINGVIDLSATASLPAGRYVLNVTATNANDCGSASAEMEFTINPKPTISLNAPEAICETEVATKKVTFTKTNTLNVEYWLEKNATTYDHQTISAAAGEITLTTNTLPDGTYTLKVTPVSEHGCTGTQQTTTLIVHPQPLITLTAPGDACAEDATVSVNFTLADAGTGTYTYTLYNPSSVAVIGPTNKAATASGTIVLDIHTLPASASNYTLKVNAVSDHGCKAVEKQVSFKINTKPQAQLVSVPEQCDNEATTTVTYQTTNADTCYYYIKSLGKGTMKGVKKSNGVNGTFSLDISALNCVGTSDWVDTLFLVSNTSTCHSDTVKKAFIIRVLPTVTLSAASVDACYPVETINVGYTSTNADSLLYTFTKSGALTPTLQGKVKASASGTLALNTTGLTDGTYTLTVNCFSTYKCNNSTPAVKTIKILKQPEITVDDIANICQHEVATINVTFSMTYATKYKYELKLGSTLVASGDDQTTYPLAIKADTLHAGNYSLLMTAKSDDCGSTVVEKTFRVYPQPTVRINDAHRKDSICEANTDTWSMTYTASTNADSVHYWLKTDPALTLQKERGWKRTSSETSFNVTGLSTLPDGRYKLIIQSYSQYECKSVPDTVPFVIKNRPSLKVSAIDPKCYPADAFTVAYTPTDADSIIYSVDSLNGGNKIATTAIKVQLGHSFVLNTTGWLKGTYVLHARPVSALGCDSLAVNVQFTIVNQPEITGVQIVDTCVDATNTTVKFTATDATDYRYYIKSKGATTLSAWTAIGTGTFTIPVAGSLVAGTDSLILVVKNGTTGCESDSVRTKFEIFPLPTASITPTSSDLSQCVSYYKTTDMLVAYTSTADSVKWELKRGSTTVHTSPYEKREANIKITSDKLTLADPSYTLSIIGLKTVHSCEVTTPISVSFALYDTAAVVLNHIDSVCAGNAVTSTYTATNTTSYTFKVDTLGGATKINHTTPVTTINGVIDLSGTAALPAGKYILRVYATNAPHNCGGSEASMPFTINPMPEATITSTSAELSQCVTYYKSTDMHVAYTTTADSIKWVLKKGGYGVVQSTGYERKAAYITIPSTSLAESGSDFTLTINGLKTVYGCEVTTPQSVNFTLYDTAVVVLTPIAPVCEHNAVASTYTQTNTNSYTFKVDTLGGATKINHTTPVTTIDGVIDLSGTADLPAGTYTLRVFPTNSPHDCKGAEVKTNFTIYKQPAVTSVQITDTCVDAANTPVSFTSSDATHYKYYVTSKGIGSMSAWQSNGSFNLTVAGNLTARKDSLVLIVKNNVTGCESEPDTTAFEIFPLPTATITSTPAELSQCVSYYKTQNMLVAYTSTADSVKWELKRGSTTVYTSPYEKRDANIKITSDKLTLAAPSYTLSIIGLKTIHSCEVTTPISVSFALYDTAAVVLNHIDSVCAGNAVTSTYTATNTTSYTFKVDTLGGATKINHTTPVTTINGVIDLSGTAALPAGKYILRVYATNAPHNCGGSEASMPFTINPMPEATITSTSAELSQCVTYYKNTDMQVAYTTTADSIKWVLTKGGANVTASTGYVKKAAQITIPHANLTASGSDYTLTINGLKTVYGCEVTTPQSVNFTLYDTAVVVLTPIAPVCEHNAVASTYTQTNTNSYTFKVDTLGGATKINHTTPVTTIDGVIDLSATADLPAGTYTLRVFPTNSPHDCKGAEVKTNFTIYKEPTVDITSVTEKCEDTKTSVAFTYNGASTHYIYWIDTITGMNKIDKSATPMAIAATFDADINGLKGGRYRLRIQTSNGTTSCVSEPDTLAFNIWPLPTITLSTAAIDECYPADTVTLPFTHTDAATYSYTLTLQGESTPAVTKTDISVVTGTPMYLDTRNLAAGTYTVSVTAKSSHDCNMAAAQTRTFKILDKPSLTISHIDSVCHKTATVPVSITTKHATNYAFVVKDEGNTTVDSGSGATTGSTATAVTTNFTVATATLAAGDYTVYVDVTNSSTGCASKQDTMTFTINPTPSVTLVKPDSICEGTATHEVSFATKSHTKTVSYYLMKGATPTGITGTDVNVTTLDALTLSIGALNEGDYTLYVTPTSEHGCVGAEVNTTFYIKNKPDFVITPEDHCAKDTFMYVTYTASADARTYTYNIYTVGGSSTPVRTAVDKTIDGAPIKVNILSLPAAHYRIEARATSDLGCQSDLDTKLFEIFTKPDANVTSMESVCEGSATATATFTSGNATSYYYEVEGTTINGTGLVADGNTFDVNVSTLLASNADNPYILLFVTKSTECESDTIRKPFAIWHIPVTTIDSVNDKCVGDMQTTVWCQPDAYTTQAVLSLKRGTTPIITDSTVTLSATHKTFTIPVDALPVGTYTVELTPRSVHPTTTCTGAMVTSNFEIHPLPTISAITLDSAAVCEGTDSIHATFSHTGATSYSYELRRSGTTSVLRSGNKTGLADGTSKIGIDLLAPDVLPTLQTYELSVTMKSAFGCVKTETATFFIRKNPVVTLSQTYDHQCQPVDSVKLHYTNQGADIFRWEVRDASNNLIKADNKLDVTNEDDWTIRFAGKLRAGAYTLTVVPASAYCPGDEKSITFHVDTVIPIPTNATICHGERYDWVIAADCNDQPDTLMRGLTTTTHQMDTLYCGEGHCNKVYELNLTVMPEYAGAEETHSLCQDEVWIWRGKAITEAGAYADTVKAAAASGCDSIYRVTVSKVEPVELAESTHLCYGESLLFNGKSYNNLSVGQTVLLDTIASAAGCDSVYMRLNVQVGERYYDSVTVSECERYTWPVDGNTYTHSGIYRAEYATVDGCDSVYVLNLTINEKYEFYEAYDILDTDFPFTVHAYTYTADGSYTRSYTSQGGCDSIYHFTITSHPLILPKDTLDKVICEDVAPFMWRGNSYSNSGWYSVTTTDSIHLLNLTVNKTYSDTSFVHACGSYTWHGTPYTASGIYNAPDVSSCGCDSSEVLVLTIGHPSNATVNTTVCQYELTTVGNRTFVPNETTYPSFTQTLTNAEGCDSVITYNVTVTPRTYTMPDDMFSFCEGKTYTWHGHTYDERGTYYDSVMDPNGCTITIHTLHLKSNPQYIFDEDVEVSELALPYVWRGHLSDTLLRTNGDYYERLATAMGCDSIYHIHFHVNFVTRDTVYRSGCDSVLWNTTYYKESGLYSDTVFTDSPKDSLYSVIHFCDVKVYHRFDVVEPDFTICRNEAFKWHGQDYAANSLTVGDHLLTYPGHSVHGCDSTYKATVHVANVAENVTAYDACPSELPYNWRGQLLSTARTYYDSLVSAQGCDSIFVMNFTIQSVTAPDIEVDTLCKGASKDWYDLSITAVNPGEYTYYKYYTKPGECDSTYHQLNLKVGETYDVGRDTTVHICQGDAFVWYGIPRSVRQIPANLQPDGTYAEDFDTIKLTHLHCDSLEAHLHLIMHLPDVVTAPAVIECDSFVWGDTTIFDSGVYTRVLASQYGCDSTVTINVTVNHSDFVDLYIDTCDSYYWPLTHKLYDSTDVYEYRVPQMGGTCDSVVMLHLTIRNKVEHTTPITWCHEFSWGETGQTYHSSGLYKGNTHTAANGCDSIPYLLLTLNDSVVKHIYDTGCDTYTWNSMTYTGSTVARYQTTSLVSGCDSITYLHLTIYPSPTPKTLTLNECREFTDEDGITHYETYDDTLYLPSPTGCDTAVYRHVVITQPDSIYHTGLHGCENLTWNGTTYYYSQSAQQDYLCDSVVFLTMDIDRDKDSSIYVTAWDSYTWQSETYVRDTVVTKTLTAACGCDSIVTLHLILNSSMSDEEWQHECLTYTWPWSGETYTETCDTVITQRIDIGLLSERDSTRTLHLTIEEPQYIGIPDEACDYYAWHGQTYYNDTTVIYEHTEICDNVDTLYLRVHHKVETTYADTACDVLTINGKSYFSDTTFVTHFLTAHGCDSAVTYKLKFNHRTTQTVHIDTCTAYTWEGDTYTQSGSYTKVLTGVNGCDSVVTLVLSIYPEFNQEFSVTSCNGFYVWDGRPYTASGDYVWSYQSVNGCDSTVTMHLTLPAIVSGTPLDTTVCEGLMWHGRWYDATDAYHDTLTSLMTGCDSVAWLFLTVDTVTTGSFSATAQSHYTWRSETYYASGDYQQRFQSETGNCDSIVTLHLTITNPLPITHIADTACDAYTWDSETFYESGTYTRNFPLPDGSDSITELALVITHDTAVHISKDTCEQYMWNGTLYTSSGTYTQVLSRASGCDSVVTLTLTIHESFNTEFAITARDIYTWDGQSFTASGDYTHSYSTVHGCDSTATLHLTIISNVLTDIDTTVCSAFVWADSVYTHSTIHSHVYTAANGCDSVVTLTLEVNEPVSTEIYDTVCGAPYSFAGESLSHTGIYYDTLTSALTGCDSIVTLHLQWCTDTLCIDSTWFTVDTVCGSYVWDNETYTATGTYSRHYRLDNGCDSVSTMRLEINPKYQIVRDTTACDSLFWRGTWYYESGYYHDTVPTVHGCDSVLTLRAIVGHTTSDSIDVVSCDAMTINGETFTETGVYHQLLTNVSGCDSLLTVNLTIHLSQDTIVEEEACDTLLWNGEALTETGFYPMVLTSDSTGCDSVVNLHLIVYNHKEISVVDTLTCDSLVWGPDKSGNDTLIITDGIYIRTFTTATGCDSIVTMDLRLLHHDTITVDTVSCDSLVWISQTIYESGTYIDTLTNSVTGCDSIITAIVTINPTLFSDTTDTVAPPFHVWWLNGDTLWASGDYVDTVPSKVTGCDSIVTLHLMMTDSIILDPLEPVRLYEFGYCPGDTAWIPYNLLRGYPTHYTLIFNTPVANAPASVTDTTYLTHYKDSMILVPIPELCPPGTYCAKLQLFEKLPDDYSGSDIYDICINVNVKGKLVSMWTDVVAMNNYDNEYIGYQWYKNDILITDATDQYYSDGEDLDGFYRAMVQLASDSSWVYTCEEEFHLSSDSLYLLVYPTPAPSTVPVTIKALGILMPKLMGARLTITNAHGNVVHTNNSMTQREEVVTLPAGFYIVNVTTTETEPRTATAKFTVF